MSIAKTPSGRFRAELRKGREYLGARNFDTRREAVAWLKRETAALEGGVDPRAGKARVGVLLEEWLKVRETTVAPKTYKADVALRRQLPQSIKVMSISAVTDREIARTFELLLRSGLDELSVVRYRASLSSFFGWAVRERLIAHNPVRDTQVPHSAEARREMMPFTERELEAAYQGWREHDQRLADIFLVLGWSGLRWAEARGLTVEDIQLEPSPAFLVRKSTPEGHRTKAPKGRKGRRVPIANRILPIVMGLARDKKPGDLLLTTHRGYRLHRTAALRTLHWADTGQGRRIHDLRHTAACLWLARGVDPGTVQAWLGHTSIATTNRYLHHLGTSADLAGLSRLNRTEASVSDPTSGSTE